MDASTLSSEETQATQIINSVLPQHSVPETRAGRHTAVPQKQIHDGTNRLESSSSSSQNGSTAQYHYFGLASTQTDSQVDGASVSEGSQKEHVHASGSADSVPSHSPVLSRPLDPSRRVEQDATELRRRTWISMLYRVSDLLG
ncbi:hypothetical protein DAEQUDRAFT_225198 [Daedalea quercina L-15889]|uniref:Uncharacterized protein n=1 Tax=Daedalea quercina L-15889 TaxID=1314783 RepID=A0A165QZY4_9APHY|nr:hypothetical protein DAEQUDRAFT_225198 [Daedalea quercina L-15889]